MFVLRIFNGNAVQINETMGNTYTVTYREINPDEFREVFKSYFNKNHVADNDPTADDDTKKCYAFVGNGDTIRPLWKGQTYYMMTESGKTFANLTYR